MYPQNNKSQAIQGIAQALGQAGIRNMGRPAPDPQMMASIQGLQQAASQAGINPRLGPRMRPQQLSQGSPGMRPGMTFNRQSGRYMPNQRPQMARPPMMPQDPMPQAPVAPTMEQMQLGMPPPQRAPEMNFAPRQEMQQAPIAPAVMPPKGGLAQLGTMDRRKIIPR